MHTNESRTRDHPDNCVFCRPRAVTLIISTAAASLFHSICSALLSPPWPENSFIYYLSTPKYCFHLFLLAFFLPPNSNRKLRAIANDSLQCFSPYLIPSPPSTATIPLYTSPPQDLCHTQPALRSEAAKMMIQEHPKTSAELIMRPPPPPTGAGGGGGSGLSSERRSPTLKPPEQVLKCPRCESMNTKFCYYNNYSLTQPRHFCKNCRRYWTKGGALRNVPVGGGCRKNKRANKKSPPDPERRRHHLDHLDHETASSCTSDVTNTLHLQALCSKQQPISFMEFPGLAAFARLQQQQQHQHQHHQEAAVTMAGDQPSVTWLTTPASGTATTTGAASTSILQSSCQALSNLPSLESTLLALNFPVVKSENMNVDVNSGADMSSFFESPNGGECLSAAEVQWRIQQHRLAMLLADHNNDAAADRDISRLHVKPFSSSCKPDFSCLYNTNTTNNNINNLSERPEWQPAAAAVGGGDVHGHHAFDGAVDTGYWSPVTSWPDYHHYASPAGALP